MRNVVTYCFIVLTSLTIYCCNDSQKATTRELPADTMSPDVSETQKVIPVDVKGDSAELPVKSPK